MEPAPSYRFLILAILLITTFSWGLVLFGVPVTLSLLMSELHITNAEAGALFGSLYLSLVLGGVTTGFLTKRMGLKKFLLAGMLLGGVSGVLRGLSYGYLDLLIYSLLFSFSTAIITSGSASVIRVWFRSRQYGMASGLWNAFFGVGALTAMVSTVPAVIPLAGGWRGAFILYAAPMLIASAFWHLLYRDPQDKPSEEQSLQTPRGLLHSLNFWLVLASFFLIVGNQNAAINWMPILLEVRGLTSEQSGALSALVWLGALTGSVAIPSISDRIGRRILPVMVLTPLLGLTIYGLTLMGGDSPYLPINIFGLGFTSSYAWAMFLTITMELPDVGRENMARASGLLLSASGVGAFFLPVLGGLIKDFTGSLTPAFLVYASSTQLAVVFLAILGLRKVLR
ncbi:putative sulfoacetate transporter SauU [archaeon HR01]|nr:putative sulfoacetate transporter SauU [archaeon HR01]